MSVGKTFKCPNRIEHAKALKTLDTQNKYHNYSKHTQLRVSSKLSNHTAINEWLHESIIQHKLLYITHN